MHAPSSTNPDASIRRCLAAYDFGFAVRKFWWYSLEYTMVGYDRPGACVFKALDRLVHLALSQLASDDASRIIESVDSIREALRQMFLVGDLRTRGEIT